MRGNEKGFQTVVVELGGKMEKKSRPRGEKFHRRKGLRTPYNHTEKDLKRETKPTEKKKNGT